MTLDRINSRLEELKTSKTQIQGLETEVYARIVGYYRSVRNWNKGKKEEYTKRINYTGLSDERPLPGPGPILVPNDDSQKELSFSPKRGRAVPPNTCISFAKPARIVRLWRPGWMHRNSKAEKSTSTESPGCMKPDFLMSPPHRRRYFWTPLVGKSDEAARSHLWSLLPE
jgi:hypothetical protein